MLDFFAWYCSICQAHRPDLVKLRDKYKGEGLIVLAINDSSLKTLDEINAKMGPLEGGALSHVPLRTVPRPLRERAEALRSSDTFSRQAANRSTCRAAGCGPCAAAA